MVRIVGVPKSTVNTFLLFTSNKNENGSWTDILSKFEMVTGFTTAFISSTLNAGVTFT